MSPKELMYIEDVLGHEQQMKVSCNDIASKLSDTQLSSFVQSLSQKHEQCFQKFYGLLK